MATSSIDLRGTKSRPARTGPSRPDVVEAPRPPDPPEQRPAFSVLIRVRSAVPDLRPAEQRVASAVLADPAGISERSITAVARLCDTSETTVLRFCRAIGLAGYPELRIALARAAQGEEDERSVGTPTDGVITAHDSLADVVATITYATARAATDTGAALDAAALDAAVEAVAAARRVDVYGVGASALVGQDLHRKLHRIGLVSFVWPDPHEAVASASALTPADVAIGISHTGTTRDVLDPLRVARQRGATTVAVTNFDRSAIVALSDIVLTTAARETTFRSGSMTSRVPQLMLVDCLFAGVALRSFDRSVAALDATHDALLARHDSRHPA